MTSRCNLQVCFISKSIATKSAGLLGDGNMHKESTRIAPASERTPLRRAVQQVWKCVTSGGAVVVWEGVTGGAVVVWEGVTSGALAPSAGSASHRAAWPARVAAPTS
eukprot:364647-Chlamydomonas_euryale.AAC.9